jgi:transcriptional regulator with XRE-family HTH domain
MAKDAERLAAQAERLTALKEQARGVTFRKVAEAVGVTERQAQRWFAGDSDIDDDNLVRLATYFGTTPDYIEYGTMKRDTPEPFPANDGFADRLLEIERRLVQIEATQKALLASMQELAKRLPPPSTGRRSRAS